MRSPRPDESSNVRRAIWRFLSFLQPAGAIVVFVELDHVEVERDLELAARPHAGEDPAQHVGLVDLEAVGDGDGLALRAADLSAAALDAYEVVGHVLGRPSAVDVGHDLTRRVVAAAGRRVILAAGLELHALVGPAHRPVDTPGQLDVAALAQVDDAVVCAGAAVHLHLPTLRVVVGQTIALPVEIELVSAALAAEAGQRQPALRQGLVPVLVEDPADGVFRIEGAHDAAGVLARPVAPRLADELGLDAQWRQAALERLDVMGRVAVGLAEGIGHVGDAPPKLRLEHGLFGHVHGHLAEHVEVVPRVDEAYGKAAIPERTRHEIDRDHLAEVAHVDDARRRDARGDGEAAGLGVRLVGAARRDVGPMRVVAVGVHCREWSLLLLLLSARCGCGGFGLIVGHGVSFRAGF
jgi:hypothetical protein